MTWEERLQEGAYTPANSERQTFAFTDVSRNRELKGTAFEFADSNETYVQRTGATAHRYPLRLFFSGPNCDLQADAFEAALALPGIGKLEHPRYGTVNVVPLGEMRRLDGLVTDANQVIIEVTFFNTVGAAYPTAERDPASEVAAAIAAYNAAAAREFEDRVDVSKPGALSAFTARYQALLDTANAALQGAAGATEESQRLFNAVYDSINQGLNTLAGDPLTLAAQTLILVEAPARAAATFSTRLEAYKALSQQLLGVETTDATELASSDLYATASTAASANAALTSTFETRKQALTAAESLLTELETVTDWRDAQFNELGLTDLGDAYRTLQDAVSLAAGFLVQASFSLALEKRVVLTRNRTIVDLVAELYGEVDERLDFFIETNGLAWDELLELPAGREVVYYE